jgi:hypothetical protein
VTLRAPDVIERTVGFVKKDFFIGGNFTSFTDLNSQLQKWLSRVNSISNGTTHEIPIERFKQENLQQLGNAPPYHNRREENRKIARDSFISYLGNLYSVPYRYAGMTARLQISDLKRSVLTRFNLVMENWCESKSISKGF